MAPLPGEAAARGVLIAPAPPTAGRVERGEENGGRAGTVATSASTNGAAGVTQRALGGGARGDEGGAMADADEEDDDDEDRRDAGEPDRSSALQPVKAAGPLARTTSTADSSSKHASPSATPDINSLTARMTALIKAVAAFRPPIADDIAPPKLGRGGREGVPSTRAKRIAAKGTAEALAGPPPSVCIHHTRSSRRGRTPYAWFGLLWPDTSMATQVRARKASASGVVGMQKCWGDPRRRHAPATPGGRVVDAHRTRGLDFRNVWAKPKDKFPLTTNCGANRH